MWFLVFLGKNSPLQNYIYSSLEKTSIVTSHPISCASRWPRLTRISLYRKTSMNKSNIEHKTADWSNGITVVLFWNIHASNEVNLVASPKVRRASCSPPICDDLVILLYPSFAKSLSRYFFRRTAQTNEFISNEPREKNMITYWCSIFSSISRGTHCSRRTLKNTKKQNMRHRRSSKRPWLRRKGKRTHARITIMG